MRRNFIKTSGYFFTYPFIVKKSKQNKFLSKVLMLENKALGPFKPDCMDKLIFLISLFSLFPKVHKTL